MVKNVWLFIGYSTLTIVRLQHSKFTKCSVRSVLHYRISFAFFFPNLFFRFLTNKFPHNFIFSLSVQYTQNIKLSSFTKYNSTQPSKHYVHSAKSQAKLTLSPTSSNYINRHSAVNDRVTIGQSQCFPYATNHRPATSFPIEFTNP